MAKVKSKVKKSNKKDQVEDILTYINNLANSKTKKKIKKEFSKDNSDYYSPKKTIIFDERFTEEIVSYLVNNDELIIIFKDGNIVTFALSNWFDNENLVRGLQIFLFSLLRLMSRYLQFHFLPS